MNEAILTAVSNRRPFSIITANGHYTYNVETQLVFWGGEL